MSVGRHSDKLVAIKELRIVGSTQDRTRLACVRLLDAPLHRDKLTWAGKLTAICKRIKDMGAVGSS